MGTDSIHTQNFHLEAPQSVEQTEKNFTVLIKSQLRTQGYSDEFLKSLKAKQIVRNIFTVGTDRVVSMFCNEK